MCNKCQCKKLLENKNISATVLRRKTIKVLTQANQALTPVELLKRIRKIQSINKVTLYRILALLEKKEILRKILTTSNISCYQLIDPNVDGRQNLGPHFTCRICKKIIPFNSPSLLTLIEKKLGNKFRGPLEITIEGIGPKCAREKK